MRSTASNSEKEKEVKQEIFLLPKYRDSGLLYSILEDG